MTPDREPSIIPGDISREMDSYWTHRSESYSRMNLKELESDKRVVWADLIFSGLDESAPLRILDMGCGPGFFSILCALRGHCVTGTDLNEKMLERAGENASCCGAKADFVHIGEDTSPPPESFDLLVSRNVTWALPEPEVTLRGWMELVAPGGTLRYFDASWYGYLADEPERADVIRLKDYSKAKEMERMASSLPMTYRRRPEWDEEFWKQEGYSPDIREGLNPLVYDAEDARRYRAFPLFMISVVKYK